MTDDRSLAAPSSISTGHILLVEDNAEHVELIRRALARSADQITDVSSLAAARAVLQEEASIDLVIIDLLLTDGRGMDLLADDNLAGRAPAIVLTSHGDEQSAVEALKQGAIDYLPKSAETIAGMASVVQRAQREWKHILARRAAEAAVRRLNAELEDKVKQRTAELAEAYEQLKEMDRLKSKFIADISHELRTPLTTFRLYLDLLRQGDSSRRAHYEAVLAQEAERMQLLMERVLAFASVGSAGTGRMVEAVDLNELVARQVQSVEPTAAARGLAVAVELAPQAPLARGDAVQLGQVVSILLTNALAYTPAGRISVRTADWDEGELVRLEVADTGMGLDEDELAHCFERFYRGKRVGQSNIPGVGLGLTLARALVDLHHGHIDVESAVDEGSTFFFSLPIADASASIAERTGPSARGEGALTV